MCIRRSRDRPRSASACGRAWPATSMPGVLRNFSAGRSCASSASTSARSDASSCTDLGEKGGASGSPTRRPERAGRPLPSLRRHRSAATTQLAQKPGLCHAPVAHHRVSGDMQRRGTSLRPSTHRRTASPPPGSSEDPSLRVPRAHRRAPPDRNPVPSIPERLFERDLGRRRRASDSPVARAESTRMRRIIRAAIAKKWARSCHSIRFRSMSRR